MMRAVVFDFDGALTSGEGVTTEPARLLDVDPVRFADLAGVGRRDYELGGSETAYWTPILTGLNRPATPETIRNLARLDAGLRLAIRPGAAELLTGLRQGSLPVAVLANAPFALDQGLLDVPYAADVDAWFVSASMGVGMPSRAAYHRVTELLDVPPDTIAFIAADPDHLAGAERVGWITHRWVSDADTHAWLAQQGAGLRGAARE